MRAVCCGAISSMRAASCASSAGRNGRPLSSRLSSRRPPSHARQPLACWGWPAARGRAAPLEKLPGPPDAGAGGCGGTQRHSATPAAGRPGARRPAAQAGRPRPGVGRQGGGVWIGQRACNNGQHPACIQHPARRPATTQRTASARMCSCRWPGRLCRRSRHSASGAGMVDCAATACRQRLATRSTRCLPLVDCLASFCGCSCCSAPSDGG